jgi:hypothetical protein
MTDRRVHWSTTGLLVILHLPNHNSGDRVSPVTIARLETADPLNAGMNVHKPFSLPDSTAATCPSALIE